MPSYIRQPRRPIPATRSLGAAWSDSLAIERLTVRHRAPVWVRSTFQMAALGELGPPRPDRQHSILFVDLGAEISSELAVQGRLQSGAQGVAGQLGHTWAGEAAQQTLCRCGNTGCLETLAGSDAVVRAATETASDGRSRRLAEMLAAKGELTVADVGVAAQGSDAVAAQLLARCGRLVGVALAALVNALDPSSVVLGGELAQTGDILLAAIRDAIYRHSHPLATRDLRIVRSNMGGSASLAGAALMGRASDLHGLLSYETMRNLIHSHATFRRIWIEPFQWDSVCRNPARKWKTFAISFALSLEVFPSSYRGSCKPLM